MSNDGGVACWRVRRRRNLSDAKPRSSCPMRWSLVDASRGTHLPVRRRDADEGLRLSPGEEPFAHAEVHPDGRGIVWSGSREVAELKRDQIRLAGPDFYAAKKVDFPLGVTIEPGMPGGTVGDRLKCDLCLGDRHPPGPCQRSARRRVRQAVNEHADALVVTGDIAESQPGFDPDGARHDEERPEYFVLGNHDFYRGSIASTANRWVCCQRQKASST